MLTLKTPEKAGTSTKVFISFGDWLELRDKGVIQPYSRNRGFYNITESRANKYAANFSPLKFNSINIYDAQDGTFVMTDGHHRDKALHILKESGRITSELLNQRFPLIIVHKTDWEEVYQGLNDQKQHSNLEKVTNLDFPAGKFNARVERLASFHNQEDKKIVIRPEWYSDNVELAFSLEKNADTDFISVNEIFPQKSNCKEYYTFLNSTNESCHQFSYSTIERLADAYKAFKILYLTICTHFPLNAKGMPQLSTPVEKLLIKHRGFYQGFMADYIYKGKTDLKGFSLKNPKKLARLIITNSVKLDEYFQTIPLRHKEHMNLAPIVRIFNKR